MFDFEEAVHLLESLFEEAGNLEDDELLAAIDLVLFRCGGDLDDSSDEMVEAIATAASNAGFEERIGKLTGVYD